MIQSRLKTFRTMLTLACFAIVGLASSSFAASLTPQQRAQGLTSEDLEANKKKLGNITNTLSAKLSRDSESKYRFNGMVGYGLRQDVAQDRAPNLSTHRVYASGSMSILDRPVTAGFDDDLANEIVTFNLMAAGQYSTVGNEVQGNATGGPVEAADVDLSASRGFELDKIGDTSNALDVSIGSTMPTSLPTQYEGIVAVPYANVGWAIGFQGGRFNLTQAVSADYIVNQYTHSPVTREVNPEASAGYSISASARLGAGFRFTIGGGARLVRHLDDSVTDALSNFQILAWTRGFATITLRHSNGSRAEDHQSSLWFVDEYRRIISLGLSVRF